MDPFIGVHVGAGCYDKKNEAANEKLCRQACLQGMDILRNGGLATDATTAATVTLENSHLTNTGYGSNLTFDGKVECEASLMDGSSLTYGAVGGITGIKNPILVAQKLCTSQKDDLSLGRVPPCILVGDGATSYARKNGIPFVNPDDLVSRKALKEYNYYMEQIAQDETSASSVDGSSLDTIGVVCMDSLGRVAASCSSGGIILKHPGRLGQTCGFGCGCWAECKSGVSAAVTTSGCGEYIMKTMLARQVADCMLRSSEPPSSSSPSSSLLASLNSNFLESPFLQDRRLKYCGAIVLRWENQCGEFLWAHTTPNMCIGYMRAKDTDAVSLMSTLPEDMESGTEFLVEGVLMN